MVGDDTVRGVDPVHVIIPELSCIWSDTGQFLNLRENGHENICVVVGSLSLDNRDKPFETHPSINMLRRQWLERPVFFAVELNKDVIPNLQNIWVVLVDSMGCITTAYSIKMDFTVSKLVFNKLDPKRKVFYLHGPQGPVAPISTYGVRIAAMVRRETTNPKSCPLHFQGECGPHQLLRRASTVSPRHQVPVHSWDHLQNM